MIESIQPERQELTVNKVEVEELVFTDLNFDKESPHKLVWCRKPFNQMMVGGLPNPLIHCDFPANNGPKTAAEAREVVRKAFIDYYRLDRWK